ncbi:MAG: tetratricopeptide repeat protein [Muribaculaceae bacterium]|nr:tetratricopeptide repeat protein [Muribaculaceae bacterium]
MKIKFLASIALISGAIVANAQGYKDGIEYYKVERYDNARELLVRNLDNAGTNKAEAYYYLGMLDIIDKKIDAAEANFNKGFAADPTNPYNIVGLGEIVLMKGDHKAAEEKFKEARKLVKKDPKVETAIARAYYDTNAATYAKQIEKCVQQARKYNAKDPDSYVFEGDRYADQKDYNMAAGQYELAFSMCDPNCAEAYVKYANVYYKVVPKVAVDRLKEYVERNPQSALAQRELAEKYYELDLGGLAAEQYGKYIENPNHFKQDEVRYAQLLFFGEKYQESYDLATRLVETLPAGDKDRFYMKRMQLYNLVQLDKFQEAEVAAVELFHMDGKYQAKDYTDYAEALRGLGKPQEALAQYEKAVEMNPDKVDLMRDLAGTYTDAENYEKAVKYYQMVVDSQDCKANDIFTLSTAYSNLAATTTNEAAKKDAIDKARKYGVEANEKVPGNYRIVQQLGRIEAIAGDEAASDKYYDEVINILDQKENGKTEYANVYKSIYQQRAVRYANAKDMENAKIYYHKWLEVEPDNEPLRQYLETLK